MADADGSHVRILQANAREPRWSPDGTQIVFVGRDHAGLDEIFTIKLDGSGLTQLTQNPGAGRICLH
jgi:Tol biopolymer transport system component